MDVFDSRRSSSRFTPLEGLSGMYLCCAAKLNNAAQIVNDKRQRVFREHSFEQLAATLLGTWRVSALIRTVH
jgi:hypothetical protein